MLSGSVKTKNAFCFKDKDASISWIKDWSSESGIGLESE